jgi:hypothetical protein
MTTVRADAGSGDNEACVSSFEDAQRFRSAQKLRAAREALSTCSRSVCPKPIAERCKRWKDAVESAMPSIALHVVDSKGAALSGVNVTIDGASVTIPDDGVLALDPGPHGARGELSGYKAAESRFELGPGEKSRDVTLRLEATPQTAPSASASSGPTDEAPHSIPTISYVLGGVGLVGLGVFAYLGASGKSRESDLETACSPHCSPDDVSALRSKYIGADIALGFGVVSLGVATWLALRGDSAPDPASPSASTSLVMGPRGVGLRGQF